MVSGIDDQLHRRWTRPGQTLRARVNHRARDPPKVTPKTSSQSISESCGNSNIIVRIMNLWNCWFPVTKRRKLGNLDASCDSNSADWRSRGSELDTDQGR